MLTHELQRSLGRAGRAAAPLRAPAGQPSIGAGSMKRSRTLRVMREMLLS